MIIYWPGVYTFNGYFSEEDLQMFWVYRYKGFSFTAARTVHTALVLAGQQGCSQADTGHLLLALVQTAQGTAADFLRRKRVTSTALAEHTAAHAAGRPRRLHSRDLAPELSKAMEFAVLGAHAASAARAENEHLLCAILEDSSCTASRWLAALGIELPQAARECRQLSGQLVLPAQPRMAASRTGRPSDKYGRDLTRLAQEGRLDPVLCRDAELDRMIEILCRRQKNNPCLLGEPGVGKSALAEALAQRIAAGQITPALRGKRVLALDMASMVAGTKYRGDFEERFKNLLEELYRDRSTILFIDEIHIIAGAGAAEGAIDAASILKPMLARGEIQLIGATTPEEYRKTIQKDSALERRFGKVMVEEPTPAAAETILTGLMPRYERYHGVSIPPEAIHAAVELSVRYLPGRYLPDKAIDLLDESCACCNLRHPEITELMETQRTVADLETREHELENPEPQNGQDAAIDYEALAAVKTDLAKQREKLPALQLKVAEIEVTMDDVAQVIELWTGVPAVKIKETEYGRLQGLEDALKAHIIGQDEAVHAVAGAIKRARADLSGRHRPASFIFVGPTGVGKTELVKQLASQLFDTVDPLISIDMSEYMEKYAVSRLIGSPPGYVGYDEAGQLTEKVRRHPYSVVLFDEIEKAHPDVMNILLQILDEGKINDAQGRTVDFSNTVICMTSNAGSTDQSGATGFGKKAEVASADRSMKALQEFLRPEFIGRVDEIITFKPLSEENLEKIAALMLDEYKPGLAAHGITLHYTQPALADIVAESSTKYGARELRRTIRKTIEDPVSDALVDGRLDGREVTLELADHDGRAVLEI